MPGCHANPDGTVTLRKTLGFPPFAPTVVDTYEPLSDGTFRKITDYSFFPGSCPNGGASSESIVPKSEVPYAVRYQLWKLKRRKDT